MEDFLHTHEAAELFRLNERSSALLLLDAPRPVSAADVILPFHPIYERAFAPAHGFASMHALVDALSRSGRGGGGPAAPRCVRFRRSVFTPHGGSSALQRSVGTRSRCVGSPLVRGLVARVLRAIPELDAIPPRPNTTELVIVRGSGAKRRLDHPGWDDYVAKRRLDPTVLVQDMGAIPVLEQMQLARSVSSAIGQHGAALTHFLWMRPNAHAREVDVQRQCECYHNIAVWMNLSYEQVVM